MEKSSFSVVLKELQARRRMDADAGARSVRAMRRFRAVADAVVEPVSQQRLQTDDASNCLSRAHEAYTPAEVVPTTMPDVMTAAVGPTLAELAIELSSAATVDELRALRRAFAATRHPDRVGLRDRVRATTEMQMANDLIDRAIAKRFVLAEA